MLTKWNQTMTPSNFIRYAMEPALSLLPEGMNTHQAKVIMLAIAFQESRLEYRKQIGGPAKGYFQFEQGGGVRGVLTHQASKPHIQRVLSALDYSTDSGPAECYAAIEHNDILACCFARLLLLTDPTNIPTELKGAWELYLRTWRPGKPHPENWADNYYRAMESFKGL